MPVRGTACAQARVCGDAHREAGRSPGQMGWYQFAARFVAGRSVLDSGCGTCKGLDLLAKYAREVRGHDLDPRLERPDVFIGSLSEIPSQSVDVVTSIDVIEHVEDPEGFIRELMRIARVGAFLSTPNWTGSRCQWPYHLREYTPREWYDLLRPLGKCEFYKGTPSGSEVYLIKHERAFELRRISSWVRLELIANQITKTG